MSGAYGAVGDDVGPPPRGGGGSYERGGRFGNSQGGRGRGSISYLFTFFSLDLVLDEREYAEIFAYIPPFQEAAVVLAAIEVAKEEDIKVAIEVAVAVIKVAIEVAVVVIKVAIEDTAVEEVAAVAGAVVVVVKETGFALMQSITFPYFFLFFMRDVNCAV